MSLPLSLACPSSSHDLYTSRSLACPPPTCVFLKSYLILCDMLHTKKYQTLTSSSRTIIRRVDSCEHLLYPADADGIAELVIDAPVSVLNCTLPATFPARAPTTCRPKLSSRFLLHGKGCSCSQLAVESLETSKHAAFLFDSPNPSPAFIGDMLGWHQQLA